MRKNNPLVTDRPMEWRIRHSTLGSLKILREIMDKKRLAVRSRTCGVNVARLHKIGFIDPVGKVGGSGSNYRNLIWEAREEVYQYKDLIDHILE